MRLNVLRTESKAELAKLEAEISQDLEPSDFMERQWVQDILYCTWCIIFYERVVTNILNNALRNALTGILNEILLPPSSNPRTLKALVASKQLAYGWLLDAESKRQVSALLKEAGLDESAIEAKAYILVADHLEKANRMLNSQREARDKALRSIAKYRKSVAVLLRRNSDRVLAADKVSFIANGEMN
jgi:hypothetical protein